MPSEILLTPPLIRTDRWANDTSHIVQFCIRLYENDIYIYDTYITLNKTKTGPFSNGGLVLDPNVVRSNVTNVATVLWHHSLQGLSPPLGYSSQSKWSIERNRCSFCCITPCKAFLHRWASSQSRWSIERNKRTLATMISFPASPWPNVHWLPCFHARFEIVRLASSGRQARFRYHEHHQHDANGEHIPSPLE